MADIEQKQIRNFSSSEFEANIKFRIRDDFSQNVVGDQGDKKILLTKSNKDDFASLVFNNIMRGVDINVLKKIKNDLKSVKFFVEIDMSVNGKNASFKVYFDIKQDERYVIQGFSFEQTVSTSMSLHNLDVRLSKIFEGFFNI